MLSIGILRMTGEVTDRFNGNYGEDKGLAVLNSELSKLSP